MGKEFCLTDSYSRYAICRNSECNIGGRFCSWVSQQGGSTSNGTNFFSINGYILRNKDGTKK